MNPQSGKSIGNFRGAILDAFVIPHNSLATKALTFPLPLLFKVEKHCKGSPYSSPKLNVAVVDLVARAVQEVPVDPEV
jgi:hypothetical protein